MLWRITLLPSMLLLLIVGSDAKADRSLLRRIPKTKHVNMTMDLKNYCESWRLNVEVSNIRGFDIVPPECSTIIGGYLTGGQYKSDVQRALEESRLYIDSVDFRNDGRESWIFDVDETLLSTVPFFEKHQFGAENIDKALLEEWMSEGKAPAIEPSLYLYKSILSTGIKIFLISSRREKLRVVTVDNLINAGFHNWTGLYLRGNDNHESIETYKATQRQQLVEEGYRLWAAISSQWSGLFGNPAPFRVFKLPNPLYHEL